MRSFNADLLYEPWDVNDVNGRPFTTFDAFWGRCLSMPYDPDAPLLPPKRIISGLFAFKLFLNFNCIQYQYTSSILLYLMSHLVSHPVSHPVYISTNILVLELCHCLDRPHDIYIASKVGVIVMTMLLVNMQGSLLA